MRGETSGSGGGGARTTAQQRPGGSTKHRGNKKCSVEEPRKTTESKLTTEELRRLAAARGRQPRSTHTHNLFQSTGAERGVCTVHQPRSNNNQKKSSTMVSEAYVTLATNDGYAVGALVLGHSLLSVGTSKHLCILVTPNVSDPVRAQLSTVFHNVVVVDVLDSKDSAHLGLLKRPELGVTFTKIHCWNLTQYTKCVFLDADIMAVQNPDELFQHSELSAACDIGWPDCFNSGMFVFSPSQDTHAKLVEHASKEGSFDGGDQGLLNTFFPNWNRVSFLFNMVVSATYTYLPAYKQYGSGVKLVHFLGIKKPWQHPYDQRTGQVTTAPGYHHMTGYLNAWWSIYTRLVHPALPSVDVQRASESKPNFDLPRAQLYTERVSMDSTHTRPTVSATPDAPVQSTGEKEVKKTHYQSHVYSEPKKTDVKPKDLETKQAKVQSSQEVREAEKKVVEDKRQASVADESDKTPKKLTKLTDSETKPDQSPKETPSKVSKSKDSFFQPYPIYKPKPYEPYQPYLIDHYFIDKYHTDPEHPIFDPEFVRSRRHFSEMEAPPMMPMGYFPQGGRGGPFPYMSRPRHHSPSMHQAPRDGHYNFPRDPRIPYPFMPQMPKRSSSRNRDDSLTRSESPRRAMGGHPALHREMPRPQHSLSPPRQHRESRSLYRRDAYPPMYRNNSNYPYPEPFNNPNFIEPPFMPQKDSLSSKKKDSSYPLQRDPRQTRNVSPCTKHEPKPPHRDQSPNVKTRPFMADRDAQFINANRLVDHRHSDGEYSRRHQPPQIINRDMKENYRHRPEKVMKPNKPMSPEQWPWESFHRAGMDMRQGGMMYASQPRSRESSLTRQRECLGPRRDHSPGNPYAMEGRRLSSTMQNTNGRNSELVTQLGEMKITETMDDSRQRWERGQPDYTGRDSFSNIQAYIDERLKQNK